MSALLAVVVLLCLAWVGVGLAQTAPPRCSTEAETFYLHDSPTGKCVVTLTLSEANVLREQGHDLRGPYLSYAEAERYLYHPATYLPPKETL